jgi:hypothetical protein
MRKCEAKFDKNTSNRTRHIFQETFPQILSDLINDKEEKNCISVAEPHPFYAAPGKNYDAAPAPTLLNSKDKFLKRTKGKTHLENILFTRFCTIFIAEKMN